MKKPTIREAKEAAQVFSRMGNHARWKGTTPEQRKDATAKATEARRVNAERRYRARNPDIGLTESVEDHKVAKAYWSKSAKRKKKLTP
jgi:hypothetical protein